MSTNVNFIPVAFNENHRSLMSLAALFRENFSIDWLVELTGSKASEILAIFEEGCSQGWLAINKPGIFFFKDTEKKTDLAELSNLRPGKVTALTNRKFSAEGTPK